MGGHERLTKLLEKGLLTYIAVIVVAGAAWLAWLLMGAEWGISTLGEMCLFVLLMVAAGSFPLPVAPRTTADVTTAVLFGAALLLEPEGAALVAVAGKLASYIVVRFGSDRLRLPGYKYPFHKYPFNLAEAALSTGLASALFHALAPGDGLLTPAVALAVAAMYLANTALVTGVVSLEIKTNPLRFWLMGTRENGPAELSFFAFGFLGALAYQASPWTLVVLFAPVAVIYLAFSRLARSNSQLQDSLGKQEALQGHIANTSKLASIGAISLDLVHQIRNPLAIMIGGLEELQKRPEEGGRDRRHLKIAQEAGWRMEEITQHFTAMGQKQPLPVDIVAVLNDALVVAGLAIPKRIETDWDYPEDLPKIEGNPVLIREALSNIFSNAIEAVDEGGRITIGVAHFNRIVSIRISDNGAGIPKEQLPKLFEPFQTTKLGGTGLGLFAAKHILEMHQGTLEIESEEGKGTTVRVSMPAVLSPSGISERGPEDSSGILPSGQSG